MAVSSTPGENPLAEQRGLAAGESSQRLIEARERRFAGERAEAGLAAGKGSTPGEDTRQLAREAASLPQKPSEQPAPLAVPPEPKEPQHREEPEHPLEPERRAIEAETKAVEAKAAELEAGQRETTQAARERQTQNEERQARFDEQREGLERDRATLQKEQAARLSNIDTLRSDFDSRFQTETLKFRQRSGELDKHREQIQQVDAAIDRGELAGVAHRNQLAAAYNEEAKQFISDYENTFGKADSKQLGGKLGEDFVATERRVAEIAARDREAGSDFNRSLDTFNKQVEVHNVKAGRELAVFDKPLARYDRDIQDLGQRIETLNARIERHGTSVRADRELDKLAAREARLEDEQERVREREGAKAFALEVARADVDERDLAQQFRAETESVEARQTAIDAAYRADVARFLDEVQTYAAEARKQGEEVRIVVPDAALAREVRQRDSSIRVITEDELAREDVSLRPAAANFDPTITIAAGARPSGASTAPVVAVGQTSSAELRAGLKDIALGMIPVYGTVRAGKSLADEWERLSTAERAGYATLTAIGAVGDLFIVGKGVGIAARGVTQAGRAGRIETVYQTTNPDEGLGILKAATREGGKAKGLELGTENPMHSIRTVTRALREDVPVHDTEIIAGPSTQGVRSAVRIERVQTRETAATIERLQTQQRALRLPDAPTVSQVRRLDARRAEITRQIRDLERRPVAKILEMPDTPTPAQSRSLANNMKAGGGHWVIEARNPYTPLLQSNRYAEANTELARAGIEPVSEKIFRASGAHEPSGMRAALDQLATKGDISPTQKVAINRHLLGEDVGYSRELRAIEARAAKYDSEVKTLARRATRDPEHPVAVRTRGPVEYKAGETAVDGRVRINPPGRGGGGRETFFRQPGGTRTGGVLASELTRRDLAAVSAARIRQAKPGRGLPAARLPSPLVPGGQPSLTPGRSTKTPTFPAPRRGIAIAPARQPGGPQLLPETRRIPGPVRPGPRAVSGLRPALQLRTGPGAAPRAIPGIKPAARPATSPAPSRAPQPRIQLRPAVKPRELPRPRELPKTGTAPATSTATVPIGKVEPAASTGTRLKLQPETKTRAQPEQRVTTRTVTKDTSTRDPLPPRLPGPPPPIKYRSGQAGRPHPRAVAYQDGISQTEKDLVTGRERHGRHLLSSFNPRRTPAESLTITKYSRIEPRLQRFTVGTFIARIDPQRRRIEFFRKPKL